MTYFKTIQRTYLTFALAFTLTSGFFTQIGYAFDFTEFTAVTLSNPAISQPTSPATYSNPGVSVAAGISLGFRLFEKLDFEPALLYGGQSFSIVSLSTVSNYTVWSIQTPLLFRYWLTEKFSLGGGIYYTYGSGNVTRNQGTSSSTVGYQDLSWSTIEGGLCLSARYKSSINEIMNFILDIRGLFGLSNIDISGNGNLNNRTLQVWAGVAFIL